MIDVLGQIGAVLVLALVLSSWKLIPLVIRGVMRRATREPRGSRS